MNTEQIMALADAYAEGYRWLTDEATEEARAALEAALANAMTEKQEPVAWAKFSAKGKIFDLLEEEDDGAVPLYTHPAPVNQQLLEALYKLEDACNDSDGCQYGTLSTSFVRDIARAAIAQAEGKV